MPTAIRPPDVKYRTIPAPWKEFMRDAGTWRAFTKLRDELANKAGDRVKGHFNDEALATIYPHPNTIEVLCPLSTPVPKGRPPGQPQAKVEAAAFEGKEPCSVREAVEWVFNNHAVPGLKAEDAPSAGAWALYQEASKPDHRWSFLQKVMDRLLPTRSTLELEDKRRDDGRDYADLFGELGADAEVPAAAVPAGAEIPGGESSVPAEVVEAGAVEQV